jgi:hypothetical protein
VLLTQPGAADPAGLTNLAVELADALLARVMANG